jgi:hypothetical protein
MHPPAREPICDGCLLLLGRRHYHRDRPTHVGYLLPGDRYPNQIGGGDQVVVIVRTDVDPRTQPLSVSLVAGPTTTGGACHMTQECGYADRGTATS